MTLPERIAYLKRAEWLGSWGERELRDPAGRRRRTKFYLNRQHDS